MNIIVGVLIVIGSFAFAVQSFSAQFDGFWNQYSAVLLLGVPIGMTIVSFRFATLLKGLRGFGRALVLNPTRERERLGDSLLALGREVRRDKGSAAAAVVEREPDPLFKALGRHVVQRSAPEEIEADALVLGRRDLENFRNAERMLSALGTFAPAMGMIGTVIGLIQLLANMQVNFER
ncbi:MAG: MotA/TolQ/ExbB proton channel family protein, partial [Myxococcota bacterium]